MKLALVHDSLTQLGGAEKVLDSLHELFPEAPLYTLVLDSKLRQKYQGWKIITSPLQKFYELHPKLQHWLALIPWATGNLKIEGYDIVLSSSSGFVKNIPFPKGAIHINYCHTPTRFLWTDSEYVKQEVPAALRPLARLVLGRMKKWDFAGAKRVNFFISNSSEVKKRVKEIYGRDSEVIYPGVDTGFWAPTRTKGNYFLVVGRLQAHKNNILAIECFNKTGLELRVVGTGRDESRLKSASKKNIKFLGRISDEQLRDEYSGAIGLVYPQVEDFGLVPLEAAACGTATLAYAKGGSLETVAAGITGEFFFEASPENLIREVQKWNAQKYDLKALRKHAENFSKEKFKQRILEFINEHSG